MGLLAVVSLGVFVLVGAGVGIRLLALARRTRGLPELVLGAGLAGVCFGTLPALVATVALEVGPIGFRKALFVAGLIPIGLFVASFHLFTWSVFRRRSRMAGALALAAAALSLVDVAGIGWVRIAHETDIEAQTRPWALGLMALFAAGFAWTGVESMLYHAAMRRRAALGLADPAVANRFLLWGLAALAAIACMLGVGMAKVYGVKVVAHPGTQLLMGTAGLLVAGCWYLAFLPPAFYTRWLAADTGR